MKKRKKKFKFRKEDIPFYILTALVIPAFGIGLISGFFFRGESYTIDESLKSTLLTGVSTVILCIFLIPWVYYGQKIEMRGKKKYQKMSKFLWIFFSIILLADLVGSIDLVKSSYESLNSPKRTEYVCVVDFRNGNLSRGSKKGIREEFDDGRIETVTLAGPTYSYGWGKNEIEKNEKVRLTYSKNYHYGNVTKLTREKC